MSRMRCRGSFWRQRRSVRRTESGVPSGSATEIEFLVDDRARNFGDRIAGKRARAGEHLVQHNTKRPDVRAFVGGLAACLLGGHVRGGPHQHALPGQNGRTCDRGRHRRIELDTAGGAILGCHDPRQAKVEHFHRAIRCDLNVCGLQIAMHDALLVRRLERIRDLTRDHDGLGDGNGPARDPIGQRFAFDELQYQRAKAAALPRCRGWSQCAGV